MRARFGIFFIGIAALLFAGGFLSESIAQKKDRFSHATAAHKKLDCGSCHKNPTANWVTARGYPDVADFPGHVACFACHRADFFAGNRPAICASCHVNPGPRGAARFPFPVRSRSHEFSTIFPHDVHQDIIASNVKKSDVAVAHFVNASYVPDDEKKPQFTNCAICHQTITEMPKVADRKLLDPKPPLADAATETFVAAAGFFKDSPSGHASCFTCHYQGLKPSGTNCAMCHALTAPYSDTNVISRYSLKFDHRTTNHANKDCAICHVRIAQNADIRSMKDADVPLLGCSTTSCHGGAQNDAPKGDDTYIQSALANEIAQREASVVEKKPAFQCTFCHTPGIGRYPIPASHLNR